MKNFPQDSKITGYNPDGSPQYDRRYTSADLRAFYSSQFTNGYLDENEQSGIVTEAVGCVTVAPGTWFINGAIGTEADETTLEFPSGETVPRVDAVMVRLDTSDDVRGMVFRYAVGGAAAPQPVRSGNVYELCIAHVSVTADGVSIEDTRNDSNLCGRVRLRPNVAVPIATKQRLGGVLIGAGVNVADDGTISVDWSAIEAETAALREALQTEHEQREAADAAEQARATQAEKLNADHIDAETERAKRAEEDEAAAREAADDAATADRAKIREELATATKIGKSLKRNDSGEMVVNEGNGLSVNQNTGMLEVPIGLHLSYTSDGIDVNDTIATSAELAAETNRANQAERDISKSVGNEALERANADEELSERIDAVQSGAASDLAAAIAAEKEARIAGDSENTKAIAAEAARAEAREATLAESLQTETQRATAAELANAKDISTVAANLSAETKRAEAAEEKLSDSLKTEITRATAAEQANAQAIAAETQARTDADAALGKRVDTVAQSVTDEITRATAAEQANAQAIAAEVTRAQKAEKLNADQIEAEKTAREKAVADEATARKSADDAEAEARAKVASDLAALTELYNDLGLSIMDGSINQTWEE